MEELLSAQQAAAPNQGLWFLMEYMNQWAIVFMILCLEVTLCTLMILPLPVQFRLNLSSAMSKLWNSFPRFRIVTKTLLVIITGLFFDSLRRMYSIHLTTFQPDVLKIGKQVEMNTVLAEAQRNAFLTGVAVFLFLVLYRFQAMADQIAYLDTRMNDYSAGLGRKGERSMKKEVDYDAGKMKVQNNGSVAQAETVTLKQRI
eukprot:TRINITY_DN2423_c0_g1_i1.p1 TRINITY_DN2423_c0_g1~~TRINITY_DN2423_c0_g1_i1.p1  ORF type:complete len:201 (-),score=68.81 TRINITY_DN2423_c0_g1_i1:267-869(-)